MKADTASFSSSISQISVTSDQMAALGINVCSIKSDKLVYLNEDDEMSKDEFTDWKIITGKDGIAHGNFEFQFEVRNSGTVEYFRPDSQSEHDRVCKEGCILPWNNMAVYVNTFQTEYLPLL
jgi:hypothetical protein